MTGDRLIELLPRGVPGRAPIEALTPQAQFVDPERLLQDPAWRHDGKRLYLGMVGDQPIGAHLETHVMTVAGSRQGKGRNVILPNLLLYEGSVLVTDPKGELARISARHRAEGFGQRVCVLDPFNVTGARTAPWRVRWNPMARLDSNDPGSIDTADLIADALVVSDGGERHWSGSAHTLVRGVILHVATCHAYEDSCNLSTVRRLLLHGSLDARVGMAEQNDGGGGRQDVSPLEPLRREMMANDAFEGLVQDAAADFFDRPSKERGSVLSTARRNLDFMAIPGLRDVLTGHDVDLKELKTETRGLSLYLCLPANRMGRGSRWLRLFINLALDAMEQDRTAPDIPVLFVLDEFPVLGHLKQLEDAAGQIAGFGVRLWPILQDLGQLKALYRERWQTFIGNSQFVQLFGYNDLETLNWVSDRLGTTTVVVEEIARTTHDQRQRGATGESLRLQVDKLLTGEEVARYFGRQAEQKRQLVIHAGGDPLILGRVNYDDANFLQGAFDPRD
jgi:type IV secretion system protein VirD4